MAGRLRTVLRLTRCLWRAAPSFALRAPPLPPPPPCRRLAATAAMVTPHPAGDTEAPLPPTELNRDAFTRTRVVPALRVDTRATAPLLKALRGHTLDVPKQPCVVKAGDGNDSHRLILLKEEVDALPERAAAAVTAAHATPTTHTLTLTYAHLSADAVLAALLPPGVTPPSAFETVGHIAHVNLRPEHSPHRHAIARVLLDKNPGLRTVVNKLGTITNEFRVFDMEVLAGEDDTVTTVTQHGARFTLDYRHVYWNSRLETEHARMVGLFSPADVVVDVMAGVGPFAVPAGRAGIRVYANDLNPASHHWLAANVARNKVVHTVRSTCADGRDFVRACGGGGWRGRVGACVWWGGGRRGGRCHHCRTIHRHSWAAAAQASTAAATADRGQVRSRDSQPARRGPRVFGRVCWVIKPVPLPRGIPFTPHPRVRVRQGGRGSHDRGARGVCAGGALPPPRLAPHHAPGARRGAQQAHVVPVVQAAAGGGGGGGGGPGGQAGARGGVSAVFVLGVCV